MHAVIQHFFLSIATLIRTEFQLLTHPITQWYADHLNVIQPWADWMIDTDAFRRVAGMMCALYCLSVFSLGARYHDFDKDPAIKHLPRKQLGLLVIQLIPLIVTGLVYGDVFIVVTRIAILAIVVIDFVLARSRDGKLNTWGCEIIAFVAIASCILMPMSWVHDGPVREFVTHNQKLISWSIVLTMFVYMAQGQWALAKDLFKHYLAGETTMRRLRSQVPRFLMLAFQAPHYWFAPSGAALVLGMDPIFIMSVIGAIGALVVIVASILGMFIGLILGRFRSETPEDALA
jgi:hypothetical protein